MNEKPIHETTELPPELNRWIAPPKAGTRCPFTGLTKPTFHRLILNNRRIRVATVGDGVKRKHKVAWLPDVHEMFMAGGAAR